MAMTRRCCVPSRGPGSGGGRQVARIQDIAARGKISNPYMGRMFAKALPKADQHEAVTISTCRPFGERSLKQRTYLGLGLAREFFNQHTQNAGGGQYCQSQYGDQHET
jgi:hypothetical protein